MAAARCVARAARCQELQRRIGRARARAVNKRARRLTCERLSANDSKTLAEAKFLLSVSKGGVCHGTWLRAQFDRGCF